MQHIKNEDIIALFPIPIAKVPVPAGIDFTKEIEILKALELTNTEADNAYVHHRSVKSYVLDLDQLKDLKLYIESRISEFMKGVMSHEYPGQLTQSWTNLNKSGQGTHLHSHGNSIISAVFYMDVPEGAVLRFHKGPSVSGRLWTMEPAVNSEAARENFFAYDWIDIPVVSGDLIMFPSYLQHSVPPNPTDFDRWTLAVNAVPVLCLGMNHALTELVLGPTHGPGYPD